MDQDTFVPGAAALGTAQWRERAGATGAAVIWRFASGRVKGALAAAAQASYSSANEVRMALTDDEPDLPRRPKRLEKLPLDLLGVAELQDYIGELRAEIERVEAEIARKTTHRATADSFFRPR